MLLQIQIKKIALIACAIFASLIYTNQVIAQDDLQVEQSESSSVLLPSLKLAFLDVQKCVKSYHLAKTAEKRVNERMTEFRSEFEEKKKMVEGVVNKLKDLGKLGSDPVLAESKRKEYQKEFNKVREEATVKERELRDLASRRTMQIETEKKEIYQNVFKDLRNVVEEYCKAKDIDFVVNKSNPGTVFTSGKNDITADIIKILNKDAPSGEKK